MIKAILLLKAGIIFPFSPTCLDQLVPRLCCVFLLWGGRLAGEPKHGSHFSDFELFAVAANLERSWRGNIQKNNPGLPVQLITEPSLIIMLLTTQNKYEGWVKSAADCSKQVLRQLNIGKAEKAAAAGGREKRNCFSLLHGIDFSSKIYPVHFIIYNL